MGSFNVACTASNLSINCGDKVAFIPIVATKNYLNKKSNITLPNTHMHIYSDDLYAPAMLPIFGTYNDYGGVENIEKDKNTIALEKKFGISIEQIVEALTDGRNIMEHYSSTFETFNITKFEYTDTVTDEKTLLKSGFKIIDSSERKYKHDLGFTITLKDYIAPHQSNMPDDYCVLINVNDTMSETDKNTKVFHRIDNQMSDLQTLVFKEAEIIMGLGEDFKQPETVKTMKYFQSLSGMFVHRDIYDTFVNYTLNGKSKYQDNMSAEPKITYFEKLGFEFKELSTQNSYSDRDCKIFTCGDNYVKIGEYGVEINKEKTNHYNMESFFNKWVKIGGKKLDKSLIANINPSLISFKEKLIDLDENLLRVVRQCEKNLKTAEEKDMDIPELAEVSEMMKKMEGRRMRGELGEFICYGRDWKDYIDTYFDILMENGFTDDELMLHMDFKSFCVMFAATNHLYAPACNGYQEGAHVQSALLYKKALMIAEKNQDRFMEETVIEEFVNNKDIEKAKELLEEIMEEETLYPNVGLSKATGLSKYELNILENNPEELENILRCYIV